MMGDVGNLRPALRQAARDDPLEIARRHLFDGTEGGELGFGRSFGHFILSLAWLLIGPTPAPNERGAGGDRSEEHTSELQSLMRISYAVFCLKKKISYYKEHTHT